MLSLAKPSSNYDARVRMSVVGNAIGNSIVDKSKPKTESAAQRRANYASGDYDNVSTTSNGLSDEERALLQSIGDEGEAAMQRSLDAFTQQGLDELANRPAPILSVAQELSSNPRNVIRRGSNDLASYLVTGEKFSSARLQQSGPLQRVISPETWYNRTVDATQRMLSERKAGNSPMDGYVSQRPDGSYVMQRDGALVPIQSDEGQVLMEQQDRHWGTMEAAYARIPKESQVSLGTAITAASLVTGAGEVGLIAKGAYGMARIFGRAGTTLDAVDFATSVIAGDPAADIASNTAGEVVLDRAGNAAEKIADLGGSNKYWLATSATSLLWDGRAAVGAVADQMANPSTHSAAPRIAPQISNQEWSKMQGLNPLVVEWSTATKK